MATSSAVEALTRNLELRRKAGSLRALTVQPAGLADFTSNDYLGLARSPALQGRILDQVERLSRARLAQGLPVGGATGSRLLSGNSAFAEAVERWVARAHRAESALLFNSGFDANYGLLSSVPQPGDFVVFDELCHNSMREGIRASRASSLAFEHSCIASLRAQLGAAREAIATTQAQRQQQMRQRQQWQQCVDPAPGPSSDGSGPSPGSPGEEEGSGGGDCGSSIFVAVESVYSMDGDLAPLKDIADTAHEFGASLIVDEAHGLGVVGPGGRGLVNALGLETHSSLFATVYTYGKALGAHGACVCGPAVLRTYLVNYARPLVYSTALPLHSLVTIEEGYRHLKHEAQGLQQRLARVVQAFKQSFNQSLDQSEQGLEQGPGAGVLLLPSDTAVQAVLVPGNARVSAAAAALRARGFAVLPIRAPTVPAGGERLRICLHTHNTEKEAGQLARAIADVARRDPRNCARGAPVAKL